MGGHELRNQTSRGAERHWPRDEVHAPRPNRIADRVGVWLRIDHRIGRPHLSQAVNVAVAHNRRPVFACPPLGGGVEVDHAGEHRVVLDGVEEIRVAMHQPAERSRARKERMRRNDEARLAGFERAQLVEVRDLFGPTSEVQQQHVLAANRPLGATNQGDATLGGVRLIGTGIELPIVKRDRKSSISETRSAIDELRRRMRNRVEGIVGRVGVEFDLQHDKR